MKIRARWRARLGAQALASASAPGRHDLASALGRHTGAETVTALAHELARLIRPFHESLSAVRSISPMNGTGAKAEIWPPGPDAKAWKRCWPGLYGTAAAFVNVTQTDKAA
jgi:hypothetical protein